MSDQGRASEGNRYFDRGSEVFAAVTELQRYLRVDPTGNDEIDEATEAFCAIDKYIAMPDKIEETPAERGEIRVGLPERYISAHYSKCYKLQRDNCKAIGLMMSKAWKTGIETPVQKQDVVDTLRYYNCLRVA